MFFKARHFDVLKMVMLILATLGCKLVVREFFSPEGDWERRAFDPLDSAALLFVLQFAERSSTRQHPIRLGSIAAFHPEAAIQRPQFVMPRIAAYGQ